MDKAKLICDLEVLCNDLGTSISQIKGLNIIAGTQSVENVITDIGNIINDVHASTIPSAVSPDTIIPVLSADTNNSASTTNDPVLSAMVANCLVVNPYDNTVMLGERVLFPLDTLLGKVNGH